MKKNCLLLSFFVLLIMVCSNTAFAQRDAGGSAGGDIPSDLVIDLGSAGSINIPTTSPYYSLVSSALTKLNAIITNGVVTFPTNSCYTSSLLILYYTKCINYKTYYSSKSKYSYSRRGCGND